MQTQGTIHRWNTEKGFGFIQNAQTNNVFFHIRDFRGPGTPTVGMQVVYEEIHVGSKGPRAMAVQVKQTMASPSTPPKHTSTNNTAPRRANAPRRTNAPQQRTFKAVPAGAAFAKGLMLAWLCLLVWGVVSDKLPGMALIAIAGLNLLTYFAYWNDKNAAQANRWRTPESTLHLLALLGGWPAAWWAQQSLRHKSSKQEFRQIYWLTIALNCASLVALALQQG